MSSCIYSKNVCAGDTEMKSRMELISELKETIICFHFRVFYNVYYYIFRGLKLVDRLSTRRLDTMSTEHERPYTRAWLDTTRNERRDDSIRVELCAVSTRHEQNCECRVNLYTWLQMGLSDPERFFQVGASPKAAIFSDYEGRGKRALVSCASIAPC